MTSYIPFSGSPSYMYGRPKPCNNWSDDILLVTVDTYYGRKHPFFKNSKEYCLENKITHLPMIGSRQVRMDAHKLSGSGFGNPGYNYQLKYLKRYMRKNHSHSTQYKAKVAVEALT